MKRRHWIIVLAISALAILLSYLAVRQLTVRDAGFQAASLSSVWRGEGYEKITLDPSLSRMVMRAKLDHYIAPIQGFRRHIVFEEVRSKGDEVYFFFRPNVSDTVVLYCGNRRTGKLLWKLELIFDA